MQTTSALQSFLLGVALYPDVQRKAQEELDAHIGPNRLPEFGDFDDLVYIQAIVLETLRWKPSVPLSLPHRVMCDDVYNGYFIPEGTIVLPVSDICSYTE